MASMSAQEPHWNFPKAVQYFETFKIKRSERRLFYFYSLFLLVIHIYSKKKEERYKMKLLCVHMFWTSLAETAIKCNTKLQLFFCNQPYKPIKLNTFSYWFKSQLKLPKWCVKHHTFFYSHDTCSSSIQTWFVIKLAASLLLLWDCWGNIWTTSLQACWQCFYF